MICDGLTKKMVAPELMKLLTTGKVEFFNVPGHPILCRSWPTRYEYSEQDLLEMKDIDRNKELSRKRGVSFSSDAFCVRRNPISMNVRHAILFMSMLHGTTAEGMSCPVAEGPVVIVLSWHQLLAVLLLLVVVVASCTCMVWQMLADRYARPRQRRIGHVTEPLLPEDANPREAGRGTVTRSVAVQAQATYKWKWAKPEFRALPAVSHGCFEE